jgi:hypothetical protein
LLDCARVLNERLFGADSPAVAEDLHRSARVRARNGQTEEGIELLERARHILLEKCGEDHPNTRRITEELKSLRTLGRSVGPTNLPDDMPDAGSTTDIVDGLRKLAEAVCEFDLPDADGIRAPTGWRISRRRFHTTRMLTAGDVPTV